MKRGPSKTASQVAQGITQNRRAGDVEAALQRRVRGVARISELIPLLLNITLAQARRHHREAA